MPVLTFGEVELFGGTITAFLPQDFFDASSIRQVPDNQELYLSRNGLSSIVIDLGERVTGEGIWSDEQAFGFHIEDAADPKDRLCVGMYDRVTLKTLPNIPAYWTMALTRPRRAGTEGAGPDGREAFNITLLFMLLVRLEEKHTDVLVTVHVPFEARVNEEEAANFFEEGKRNQEVEAGTQILKAVQESFLIKDWDLFVDDA